MTTLEAVSTAKAIQIIIESAKINGLDYLSVAKDEFATVALSATEIKEFLDFFQWESGLVQIILLTQELSTEETFEILHEVNYEESACETAMSRHANNEEFLLSLSCIVHDKNSCRAKTLLGKYIGKISKMGAIRLHQMIGGDPKMYKILKPAMHASVQL